MTERRPRLIVLTGAGASKPLGLPTMEALLPDRFAESLDGGERDVFDMAANWAKMQNPKALDFEYVFTGVDLIANLSPGDDLAMAFAPPRAPVSPESRIGAFQFRQAIGSYVEANLDGYRKSAAHLAERLSQIVHERLADINTVRAAELYQRFFALLSSIVGSRGQLPLFTTNYDRAVEASYENPTDGSVGFDFELVNGFTQAARQRAPQWEPGVYERPSGSRFIVKLYKLHGSLDWRREGEAVRAVGVDEYSTRSAVIYPVRKPMIAQPFRTLLDLFQQRLSESDLCIVVGNSLRDQHIRDRLIARINADSLRVVIVDPQAEDVATLLESAVGIDRRAGLIDAVQVRFGGDPNDQRELENRLVSAAARAILGYPSTAALEHLTGVESMKADLVRLMIAEEAFFAKQQMYSATVGLGGLDFAASPGNTPPQITLTSDGWNAVIGNVTTSTKCGIFIGSTAVAPATKEGEPACL